MVTGVLGCAAFCHPRSSRMFRISTSGCGELESEFAEVSQLEMAPDSSESKANKAEACSWIREKGGR